MISRKGAEKNQKAQREEGSIAGQMLQEIVSDLTRIQIQ
jgi:hypothetical protein